MRLSRKTKHYLLGLWLTILCLAVNLWIGVSFKRTYAKTPEEIIETSGKTITIEKDFLPDGQTGISAFGKGMLLTASKSGDAFFFRDQRGLFDLRFLPFSSIENTNEFDALSFEITDTTNSYNNFSVKFQAIKLTSESVDNDGICVITTFKGATQKINLSDTSFSSSSGKQGLRFDGESLVLSVYSGESVYKLVDFSSGDLVNFGALFTLGEFSNFDVKITFWDIRPNQTSKMILYSLNGQSLAGSILKNDAGSWLVGTPSLNSAEVGQKYTVISDGLFNKDVLDGCYDFFGTIEVYDPEGSFVPLTEDNSFIPQKRGLYSVYFTSIDKDGMTGSTKSFSFTCLESAKEGEIILDFPFDNAFLTVGTEMYFPKAQANSSLKGDRGDDIAVSLKIYQGNNVIKTLKGGNSNLFVPETEGEYTAVYSFLDVNGKNIKKEYAFSVAAGAAVEFEKLEDIYERGEELILPCAVQNGNRIFPVVIAPDFTSTNFQKICLKTVGTWTLSYPLEVDGKTTVYHRYFKVAVKGTSLWQNLRGISMENNAATPDYFDVRDSGLLLQASLPSSTAKFAQNIDVSSSTKNDELISFYVVPNAIETLEIKTLQIVLTDAYDSNNFITISMKTNMWGYRSLTDVDVMPNMKYTLDNTHTLTNSMYGKFTGGKISTDPIDYEPSISNIYALYYDNAERTVYASPGSGRGKICLLDLDDESVVGKGNGWKGFSTGEIELKIVFKEINDVSHIIVKRVNGIDMSTAEISDNVAPSIFIENDGVLPVAKIGNEFRLLDATAYDSIDGQIFNIIRKVYFLTTEGIRKEIPLLYGNCFIPTMAGNYILEYSAKDFSGNTGYKELRIVAQEKVDPIGIKEDLGTIYKDSYSLGETLTISSITPFGGSGDLEVKVFVKISNVSYEGLTKIEFETSGSYVIEYVVSDYLGDTATFTKNITVDKNLVPVFIDRNLPDTVVAGKDFIVPQAEAFDYSSGTKTAGTVKCFIDNQEYEAGSSYLPTKSGSFVLKYECTSAANKTAVFTKTIAVKEIQNNSYFIASYFDCYSGATLVPQGTSLLMQASQDASIKFIHAISGDDFSLNFAPYYQTNDGETIYNKNNFGEIIITLTDSVDKRQCLSIQILNRGGKAYLKLNNGEERDFSGSFTSSAARGMRIYFENGYLKDVEGKVVTELKTDLFGEAFDGFKSKKVYVEIAFHNVSSESAINLTRLNNQTLNSATTDTIRPSIVAYGTLLPVGKIGDTITLPNIGAYDVLDTFVKITVSVQAPDGTVVYSGDYKDGISFTITDYGYYNIEYEAKDSTQIKNDKVGEFYYLSVLVLNDVEPTITLNGTVAKKVKIGTVVVFPTATSEENITMKVFIVNTRGEKILLDSSMSYTPTIKGSYKIIYYAYNEDYNSTTLTFEFMAE